MFALLGSGQVLAQEEEASDDDEKLEEITTAVW